MSSSIGIPRELSHIWIGPYSPPIQWMESWPRLNPDWNYTVYGNDTLKSWNFRTRHQITEYLKRGQYAGAADLMRYEILLEKGGFMAGADSLCLMPIDNLFKKPCAYTVYENEFVRGKLVAPILACEPGNLFVKYLVEKLADIRPQDLDVPWKSTGNLFVARAIEEYNPDIIIFPSHYFIPEHFTGVRYDGDGSIYARQFFGATNKLYTTRSASIWSRLQASLRKRYAKKARRRLVVQS